MRDLIGRTFGRLTVAERSHAVRRTDGHGTIVYWRCVCDCGNEVAAATSDLHGGKRKSCGCYRVDVAHGKTLTHGQSRRGKWSRAYRAWSGMIQRCTNPKNTKYVDYGGRGITVCDRWRASFEDFLADMGDCPPGRSIDRIDNDRGYEPGNCRWATPAQQRRNQRPREQVLADRARLQER